MQVNAVGSSAPLPPAPQAVPSLSSSLEGVPVTMVPTTRDRRPSGSWGVYQALRRFRVTEFQLLLIPGLLTLVGLLTIVLVKHGASAWSWADLSVALAFVVAILLMNLTLSAAGFQGDQVLFPLVASLTGIGLLVTIRLQPVLNARGGGYAGLAERQLVYLLVGFLLLWGMILFVRRLDWLRRYKYSWAVIAIALMTATMVFGQQINGARLWLKFGPVTIEPDEVVKVILVIFLAAYLDEFRDLITSTYRLGPLRLPPLPYLMPMLLLWLLSILLVVLQNNLGTGLLFFGIFLVMLFVATGRSLYLLLGFLAFALGVYLAYQLFGRVADRAQIWLDPWSAPLTLGYQQIQSDYAFAAGHLLGVGWAYGHPQSIPVVETDYVLAVIGEELGLSGVIAVLLLYVLLIARGMIIALRAERLFPCLLAFGLTATLAIQTLIIIGGVLRLIPLTGITLPFLSAGGSSLLSNFMIVGLLLQISDPRWRRL